MSKPRLDIFASNSEWTIAWDIGDGYPGLALGEDVPNVDGDPEHTAATSAARALGTHIERGDDKPIAWETEREAKRALVAARAAVKAAASGKVLPDWAIKAKAEGWTAPKGWTP